MKMNQFIDFIKSRRSCRSFTEQAVSEADVQTILDCALAAPSGMNRQTWQFTAIVDREKIQKLARAVGKALGRDGGYDMYQPAVLILTSNEKESAFREVDNACAMENIYLAATALDLGCVWINQLKDCHDDPDVRALLHEYGVPDNHGVYGSAAIGYKGGPSREIKVTARSVIVK